MSLNVGEQQKNRTMKGKEKNLRTNLSLSKYFADRKNEHLTNQYAYAIIKYQKR